MRKVSLAGFCIFLFLTQITFSDQPRTIRISQNRVAAGRVQNGVLTVRLEITEGIWHPEADNGPGIRVQAFAEEGHGPQIPGPLIRVQEGMSVSVTLLNKTAATAKVYGLHERPGSADLALEIPPGQARSVRFQAGDPGVYYYWATTGNSSLDKPALDRPGIDGQLSGTFIVEPKGAAGNEPVFVLGFWEEETRALWVINGKMWPYTERFTQPVGQPLRTRWINPTTHNHPMHLHGAYFTVLSGGDQENQTVFAPEQRPFVVTRNLEPGGTMEIEWTPIHEGNWLFHCHILFHIDWMLGLNPPAGDSVHALHDENHMAGLVIGFTATAPHKESHTAAEPRRLDLYVAERDKHYEKVEFFPEPLIGMGYQLQENGSVLSPPTSPGPLMVLKRGEPVEITVHNQLKESTTVHWHGIELESYYDGVPGWGGSAGNKTPSIQPGGTFTAKFTPPRSGSFMYHTHMNDVLQVSMGLMGPLIVIDPGKAFDVETDKVFFVSRDGADDEKAPFLLNGTTTPPPMPLRAGKTYRLRFLLLTSGKRSEMHLLKDRSPVFWKAIAKDGADLPVAQATVRPAVLLINTGETHDFEWTPDPGDYRLEARDKKTGELQFTMDIPVRE